jgi:GNAT superfamily N-acetyltransferase
VRRSIGWWVKLSGQDEICVEHSPGVVLIRNQNTTIGYCRYHDNGDIEYIFVNPLYRRQGFGSRLLQQVQLVTGRLGHAEQPVSPLGLRFFVANGIPLQDIKTA